MTSFLILIGKALALFSRIFNLGSGGTWPGEIALYFKPDIFAYFANQLKSGMILVAGTNGKTTTARMVRLILGGEVIHNETGANLLNGLVSAFIQKVPIVGKLNIDWAILEVDEAALPKVVASYQLSVVSKRKKLIIVLLNLFRDQLDRYGEVDLIAAKWEKALKTLSKNAVVVLNADDPQIAYLGKKTKAEVFYFGIDKREQFLKNAEHATDSTYCRSCSTKLSYQGIYFSHLGVWFCSVCASKRPNLDIKGWQSPLPGLYNEYNTLAAVAVAKTLAISDVQIRKTFSRFTPAFGRQEEFSLNDKKIRIFLSKNPAGFNASLRTVLELQPKAILLVLNDRIPDGRDVSWIWDVDFEMIPETVPIVVSGDRVYDMALRMKYTREMQNAKCKMQKYNAKLKIYENLREGIFAGLDTVKSGETLYILPTYSSMLEVRKILKGRKIL